MDNKKNYAAFGKELRILRKNRELTQKKLASIAGVKITTISNAEYSFEYPPSRKIIIKIAKALDCNQDELLAKAGKISPDIIDIIISKPKQITYLLRALNGLEKHELHTLSTHALQLKRSHDTFEPDDKNDTPQKRFDRGGAYEQFGG